LTLERSDVSVVFDEVLIGERSRLFKALANETRLKILMLLSVRGEMCVCELMSVLSLTQPTASHHLGILKNAGLIRERRSGRLVFYSVANVKLLEDLRRLNLL